jgi:hypothetical protein
MCQHDFLGRRILQHRNGAKWSLDGVNRCVRGFIDETECFDRLTDLRRLWRGRPTRPFDQHEADESLRHIALGLCGTRWLYQRPSGDERPMTFSLDGQVREGARDYEVTWHLKTIEGEVELVVVGTEGITCALRYRGPDHWSGRWRVGDLSPVDLIRTGDLS